MQVKNVSKTKHGESAKTVNSKKIINYNNNEKFPTASIPKDVKLII